MRLLMIGVFLVLGSVAQAQAPTMQTALDQAKANLTRRATALQASDVWKDYKAAEEHVKTLEALMPKAEK